MGTEDLGGGLKANFKFEMDLFPANGRVGASGADTGTGAGGTSFNRTSLLGLSGGFGSIALGRDYLPTFSLATATDVNKQSYLSTVGLAAGVGSTVDRQVIYTSPSIGGVVIKASIGNNDASISGSNAAAGATAAQAAADNIGRNTNATAIYSNGPLMVGVGFGSVEAVATAATAKTEMTLAAASYDFGSFRLNGNYITVKNTPSSLLAQDSTATETNLGVAVPFGAVTAIAQIGRNTFASNITGAAASNGDRSGSDYVLGAEYTLSKRTLAYVKTGVTNKLEGTQAGANVDTKRSVTSVGILHTF